MKAKLFDNIGIGYFLVCSIIFTVSTYKPINDYIDIPHFVLNTVTPTSFVFFIGIILVLISVPFKKVYLDGITIALTMRFFLSLIPTIYIQEMPDFYGNLETTVLCVLSYFIARNYINSPEKIIRCISALFFWICFQLIAEAWMSPVSYFGDTYYYKNNLVIPIGGSNAIASKIIPCFAFSFCSSKRNGYKLILMLTLFFSLGLTKSRSGIIAGIIMLAFVYVWNGRINFKRLTKLLSIIAMFGVLLISLLIKSHIWNYAFYDNTSTILNRFGRWKTALHFFVDYPLFGAGFLAQAADYNPHNWLLSIMFRGGVVGCILAIIITILIMKKLHGCYDDTTIQGCVCFVVSMLTQGMAEIIMFTSTHDFFFWFIIGLAVNKASKYKNTYE